MSNVLHMNQTIARIRSASSVCAPPKLQACTERSPGEGLRLCGHATAMHDARRWSRTASRWMMDSLEARLQEAYERGRLDGHDGSASRPDRERMRPNALPRAIASQHCWNGSHSRPPGSLGTLEQDAYRFALAVAERIVKREITLDESVVMRQIRDAIHRIIGVETITVRVHPDDEALVRSHRPALLSSSDSVREIMIEGDDTVERGGCILESATGNVDARIGSQLRQIESALFGAQLPPARKSTDDHRHLTSAGHRHRHRPRTPDLGLSGAAEAGGPAEGERQREAGDRAGDRIQRSELCTR